MINTTSISAVLIALFLSLQNPIYTVSRALSINALLNKKYETIDFSEPFNSAFANPETSGVWFVWGSSGNGKSSFLWQLCKELSHHGRVAFNSLEEGDAETVQLAVKRVALTPAERKKIILISESMENLKLRLKKQKSPQYIIIDSFQYTQMNFNQYLSLKKAAAGKLLIFVSHAEGKQPAGRTANRVMFDAGLKIWVEGFRAFSKGRYIGENGGVYDIYPEESLKHWGELKQG